MLKYQYEYTDTLGGEANYCWVKRGFVYMPELTHFGYDGCTNYGKANKTFERELVKRVKAEIGLTGIKCWKESWSGDLVLRPYGLLTICFISFVEE